MEAQYGKLAATEKTLMEEGGNAYTFGYVSDIIDAPVEYSQFYIIDEQVPFYQMVIHGSIDYSGEALNLRDADIDDALLLTYIEVWSVHRDYIFLGRFKRHEIYFLGGPVFHLLPDLDE